jgi:transporter family-2 protein
MTATTAAVLACLVAGVAAAVQASLLGILGRRMGVLQATAFVSIFGGIVLVAAAVISARGAGALVGGLRQPLWLWAIPAVLGVIVFLTFTFAPPRIGTFGTFAILIAGQLLAGIVIDSLGLFGVARVPLSAVRVAGLVLLAGGALLVLKR